MDLLPRAFLILAALPLACLAVTRVEAVPEQGVQPDAAVVADGSVHLVYLRGDAKAADVCYTSRKPGGEWRPPVTVNATPGCAVAMGTIRGPRLALGAQGTVHVLWNGVAVGESAPQAPLWYACKPGGNPSFEPQRDVRAGIDGLDGGAAIAADVRGLVQVVWHGRDANAQPGEVGRMVFLRTSRDDGKTFANPVPLNRNHPGVCACCSLSSIIGPDGAPRVFFRGATTLDNRVMTLLSGVDGVIPPRNVDAWKTGTCPMSSSALVRRDATLLGAWETSGQVRVGWISDPSSAAVTVAAKEAKHPALAMNERGEILVAWVEGSGWNRGGTVAWRTLDRNLKPTGERTEAGRVPAWGKVAAYAEPAGNFVLLR